MEGSEIGGNIYDREMDISIGEGQPDHTEKMPILTWGSEGVFSPILGSDRNLLRGLLGFESGGSYGWWLVDMDQRRDC